MSKIPSIDPIFKALENLEKKILTDTITKNQMDDLMDNFKDLLPEEQKIIKNWLNEIKQDFCFSIYDLSKIVNKMIKYEKFGYIDIFNMVGFYHFKQIIDLESILKKYNQVKIVSSPQQNSSSHILPLSNINQEVYNLADRLYIMLNSYDRKRECPTEKLELVIKYLNKKND